MEDDQAKDQSRTGDDEFNFDEKTHLLTVDYKPRSRSRSPSKFSIKSGRVSPAVEVSGGRTSPAIGATGGRISPSVTPAEGRCSPVASASGGRTSPEVLLPGDSASPAVKFFAGRTSPKKRDPPSQENEPAESEEAHRRDSPNTLRADIERLFAYRDLARALRRMYGEFFTSHPSIYAPDDPPQERESFWKCYFRKYYKIVTLAVIFAISVPATILSGIFVTDDKWRLSLYLIAIPLTAFYTHFMVKLSKKHKELKSEYGQRM